MPRRTARPRARSKMGAHERINLAVELSVGPYDLGHGSQALTDRHKREIARLVEAWWRHRDEFDGPEPPEWATVVLDRAEPGPILEAPCYQCEARGQPAEACEAEQREYAQLVDEWARGVLLGLLDSP